MRNTFNVDLWPSCAHGHTHIYMHIHQLGHSGPVNTFQTQKKIELKKEQGILKKLKKNFKNSLSLKYPQNIEGLGMVSEILEAVWVGSLFTW